MVYLIGGLPRSGKTIIRKKLLEKYRVDGTCTDNLRFMLSEGNKELGIDGAKPAKHNLVIMQPYLDPFIYSLIHYAKEDFVLEGDVLLPKYLAKYLENEWIKCCFIGFSNVSPKDKAKNMRENTCPSDWTRVYTEEELLNFTKDGIKRSKEYKKECKKLGIKYFDTGRNFDKSMEKILKYLIV